MAAPGKKRAVNVEENKEEKDNLEETESSDEDSSSEENLDNSKNEVIILIRFTRR